VPGLPRLRLRFELPTERLVGHLTCPLRLSACITPAAAATRLYLLPRRPGYLFRAPSGPNTHLQNPASYYLTFNLLAFQWRVGCPRRLMRSSCPGCRRPLHWPARRSSTDAFGTRKESCVRYRFSGLIAAIAAATWILTLTAQPAVAQTPAAPSAVKTWVHPRTTCMLRYCVYRRGCCALSKRRLNR
jgi:hypothetical protein